MSRRKAIVGLSLICALVLGAVVASSGMAEEEEKTGTTIFTCKPEPNPTVNSVGFADEHCGQDAKGVDVRAEHDKITSGANTEFTATNDKTAIGTGKAEEVVLTGTTQGEKGEIRCTSQHSEGMIKNELGPPEKFKAEKVTITFSGCTTKGALATKKCNVAKKEINVKGATIESKAGSMELNLIPETGKPLATFELEVCAAPLGKKYEVLGTAQMEAAGPTWYTDAATTTGLKLDGSATALVSDMTMRMKIEGGKLQNPITTTTQ